METYLKTYLTERERRYVKTKAKQNKLTESEYVRQRLAEETPLPFPKYDWDEAAESIREIGRIINSIAAHANRGGYVEVDGLRECAEEFDKVFRPLEAIANSLPPPKERKLARIDDRFANKKYFHVRCTETEKNLVRLKAGYTSMSISGYVRAVLLGNSPNQKPPAGVHEIRRQVCSILNSLDQLVWRSKRANHPYWIKGTVPIAEDVRTRYHDFMNKIYYR